MARKQKEDKERERNGKERKRRVVCVFVKYYKNKGTEMVKDEKTKRTYHYF